MDPTTIGSYVNAVAKALESLNIDSEPLFQAAGIAPDIGANPLEQIPYTKVSTLYRLAVEASHDPCFGLYAARFLLPHHLHSLGYSLLASDTLLDLLHRLKNHFRLVAKTASFFVTEAEDQVEAGCQLMADICYESQDTFFAFLISTMRHLYKRDFAPLRVALVRPQPECGVKPYEELFKAPVSFSNPCITLNFSREELLQPLKGASRELAHHNDQITMAYLARMEQSDITFIAKTLIIETLPSGQASKEKIAGQLNMSPRTLQLKLSQSGTSFQKLLDKTRMDMACRYIEQDAMSISQITQALGFHENSSFYRAFKRWTGMSIEKYRDRVIAK